jgi:carboxymethylenebutenolidase
MIESQVLIPTADGGMNTFIVHPERDGPFPVILFYMDAPGIREELRDMCRRLASAGYYVMLPNLYYRDGGEVEGLMGTEAGRKRLFALMDSINIPLVMADTDALLAFADGQAAASRGGMGAVGYCMSGQYAINAAARHPDRFKAAASIYGVRLLTDSEDSPHRVARKAGAEIYVGAAETDHYAPLDQIDALAADLAANGVKAEVEVYPGVEHGFAFPQRQVYDKPAAERHWERLHALFRRNLG